MSPATSVRSGAAFVRPRINLGYDNGRPEGVKSLLELIEFSAKHNPDHIFGLQAQTNRLNCDTTWSADKNLSFYKITFSRLYKVVELASGWLVHSGTTPGRTCRIDNVTPVAIFLSSDITIFMYMAALLRIGTPVLILSTRLSVISLAHLLRETRTSTVLTSAQFSRTTGEARVLLLDHARINFINVPTFFDLNQQQGKHAEIPPVYSDFGYNDLDAIILHTSGTTGLPKPVYHAQAYILLYAACHRLPSRRESFRCNVSTLPLYHGFGLLAPCLSLSIGMPFVLLPSSTIPTARFTAIALQATGARYMLTVPSIVEDILQAYGAGGLEILRQLEILAVGGAPIKDSVVQDLTRAGINFLNHWGTTEIGPIAPIERPTRGYDGRYLALRTDLNLKFTPIDDGSDTFRLIGNAPGWKEPCIVQDLLMAHPRDRRRFRILGRADDLLVLSTGEKVLPTPLEREISRHPCVKDSIVFGDGKFELGVIVELAKGVVPPHMNLGIQQDVLAVIAWLRLETCIERGNDYVEGHGNIAEEMVILTREDDKPLKRTDKGSLARRENYALFEKEIKKCYERLEVTRGSSMPMPVEGMEMRQIIRKLVQDVGVVLEGKQPDDVDFFEAGMDSMQAMRLHRTILRRLRATQRMAQVRNDLPTDFIFINSSVDKLFHFLSSILSGDQAPRPMSGLALSREERRISAIEAMVEKYKRALDSFRDITFHDEGQPTQLCIPQGKARLIQDPGVARVMCLNRPKSNSLRARQVEQMNKYGIFLTRQEWDKLTFCECDLSNGNLSLGPMADQELLDVTHIIHNAWPVKFSWTLSSFESQIKGLINLLRIAWKRSGQKREKPVRFLFTSTIAVVAKSPLLGSNGAIKVPERAFGPEYTAEMGYAEAKWVCEELVRSVTKMHGDKIQGCSVRIGQLSGSEGSGVWNEYEHIPVLIRMSRVLGMIPLLEGSFSWMPLNRAARTIVELLFSQRFRPIYHVENPVRQSWEELLQAMVMVLQGSQGQKIKLVGYSEWYAQLRALGDEPLNLAYPLLSFFETDFLRLSTGGVVLDTTMAAEESTAMATSKPVKRKLLLQYITYWQSIGVL
ncbi:hypothetical protein AX15_004541 [Amanita polypyramis BW_CC]|nr:hypothetical protein AX15_004541 [Amanita polypyramis BW_CC]